MQDTVLCVQIFVFGILAYREISTLVQITADYYLSKSKKVTIEKVTQVIEVKK